jgi:Flagellar hook-length control protein FliK
MLTVAAPSNAPSASAQPSLSVGASGASHPGSFDSVLSAKYAARPTATTETNPSSGTNSNQSPLFHEKPHSDSAGASATQTSPAVAVPAQVPAAETAPVQTSTSTEEAVSRTVSALDGNLGAALSDILATIAPAAKLDAALPPANTATAGQVSAPPSDSQAQDPPTLNSSAASKVPRMKSATNTPDSTLPDAAPSATATDANLSTVEQSAEQISFTAQAATQNIAASTRTDSQPTVAGRPQEPSGVSVSNPNANGLSARASGTEASVSGLQQSAQSQVGGLNMSAANSPSLAGLPGVPRLQLLSVESAAATNNLGIGPMLPVHGLPQLQVSDAAKQLAASSQYLGGNHPGAGGQSSDTKSSNSDSTAAAQAAGLAQTAVGGPLHAPADASAPAGTPVGPAAAANGASTPTTSPSVPPSIAQRSASLPAAAPSSLNDIVQASQLYQHVGGAEMHIAMSTDLLGSVDVHAVVRQSTVTATIGVQRPDVQTLLANDLPALQHALSEHSLHVEQISVLGGSTGNQMDMGRHSSHSQQSWRSPFHASGPASYGVDSGAAQVPPVAATGASATSHAAGRLSVHV